MEEEESVPAAPKRPVVLPRITGMLYTRENSYRSVYGDSAWRRRSTKRAVPAPGTMRRPDFYPDREKGKEKQKQDDADSSSSDAPVDPNKKVRWMSDSVQTVIFAAAALIGLIFFVKKSSV